MYNFDPYNVLLSIATNIPVLLMTAFVLQTRKIKGIFNVIVLQTLFEPCETITQQGTFLKSYINVRTNILKILFMEHTLVIFDTHSCNIERKRSEIMML